MRGESNTITSFLLTSESIVNKIPW
jgi:hypothetical protein